MFVNFPPAFFTSEATVSLFLDILRAYGPLVAWSPMPAFRQARAVMGRSSDTLQIKQALDRQVLPHDDEQRYADIE